MQLKNKKKYFGIGLSLLFKSMTFFGISTKLYAINNTVLMSELLDQNFEIFLKNTFILDIKLRDKIFIDIRKLIVLNSYKGLRHEFSLPVNGQRTKTNARTNKNKRGNKVKSKYKKK